ncbi:MAG: TolC family protein [Muribaculaceae bacterium]|nr:TolC family protein [Muribaculaceae bacterium]
MKRTATLVIAAIWCLMTASAREVTIEECASLARENYPAVAQYGIIEATRDYTLSNASRAWLPQASLTGKATWQSHVPELPDQLSAMMHQQGVDYPGMKKLQYGASIEVSQAIWDGGLTAAKRAEARAEANASSRATDLTLYEVTGRVQEIYFATILIKKQCEQVRLTEVLLASTLNRINAMVTNGIAMQSDADEVEAQLLGCRQTIASLEAQADAYTRVLGIYIGLHSTPLELAEPPAMPTIENHRPQTELFDARLRLVNAGRKSLDAAIMPHIGAFANASLWQASISNGISEPSIPAQTP